MATAEDDMLETSVYMNAIDDSWWCTRVLEGRSHFLVGVFNQHLSCFCSGGPWKWIEVVETGMGLGRLEWEH